MRIKMELSDKLMLLRKGKGWTQAIAAKNIAIQQSYLSKLENGHYQPSEDVIEKLCIAYNIKSEELVPSQKKKYIKEHYFLLSSFMGLVLIINGYFSLIFPQTYYTYKTEQLSQVQVQKTNLSIDYHFTDNYQGDKYIKVFSGNKYEYTLISERNISRPENRWLIALGLFFLLIPISKFSFYLFKKHIN